MNEKLKEKTCSFCLNEASVSDYFLESQKTEANICDLCLFNAFAQIAHQEKERRKAKAKVKKNLEGNKKSES